MPMRTTIPFIRRLVLCCLLLVPLAVHAESVFIIDQVEAGLHETPEVSSPILKLLPTGSRLEVMAREGARVQVRDDAGTVGWIDQRFLMPSKPTRQLLNEAEAELERTRAELRRLRDQQANGDDKAAPAELQRLQAELAAERKQVAKLRSRIGELEGTGDETAAPAAARRLAPVLDSPRYLAAAVVLLLVLSVLLGAWLMDYLNRRRHGGFRV